MSLRRPPVRRNREHASAGEGGGVGRPGEALSRTTSRPKLQDAHLLDFAPPPKSFSERIAENRAVERRRHERMEQIQKKRSKGFGVTQEELNGLKNAAAETEGDDDGDPFLAEAKRGEAQQFTRSEVLQSYSQPDRRGLNRSKTAPDVKELARGRASSTTKSEDIATLRTPDILRRTDEKEPTHHLPGDSRGGGQQERPLAESSLFEPFSGFHLSKRILDYALLTRTFVGKKTFHIPDLLKIVKSPSYDPPDIEEDLVVLAVIASKSSPRNHQDNGRSDKGRGKYMVLSLTDLKWELELFLFSTAFDRFWKLSPGTVIAILNPSIMPPPPNKRDTGRFSLTLGSSDDTVLEIGTARDLGFCKSVKKDGKLCGQWVDKRHTEYCAFHVDISVRKTQAGRMEVNSMTAPFGPGGRSRGLRQGLKSGRGDGNGLRQEGPFHDRETHSQIYVAPSISGFGGRSSANLLDDEDVDPDAFHRGYSKQERLRRQIVAQERERDIARKLGEGGSGMGGTYLRASNSQQQQSDKNGTLTSSASKGRLKSPSRPHTSTDKFTVIKSAGGDDVNERTNAHPSHNTVAASGALTTTANFNDNVTGSAALPPSTLSASSSSTAVAMLSSSYDGTKDASALGLTRGKGASSISLSPIKRRQARGGGGGGSDPSASSTLKKATRAAASSMGLGWSGAYKRGLPDSLNPKSFIDSSDGDGHGGSNAAIVARVTGPSGNLRENGQGSGDGDGDRGGNGVGRGITRSPPTKACNVETMARKPTRRRDKEEEEDDGLDIV